jgi:hypothetical protein
MQRPGLYLVTLGCTFGVLCMVTVALTVAVDPYYIFGSPRWPGWNWLKPAAYNRVVAAKTYLLERVRPRTLLLGNSRIEVGFDPESPAWPAADRPVFNAGLSGRDLRISAKVLEDALAVPGLRHVLVGVDLFDFLKIDAAPAPPGPVDAGFEQDRMRVRPDLSPNPGRLLARVKDMFAATLTLDAVTDSFATLLAQHRAVAVTMTPHGFNPLDEYRAYAELHGIRDLFDQNQAEYAARFPRYPHPDYADPDRTPSFRSLREIITTARANDLDLTLMIYPYHAWVMDLLRQNGLWNSFEAWKRALVRVVAGLDPLQRVRIIDFSGYNQYTTEPVPAPGDIRSKVRWYWEPGHFRPALGERIIDRLYGGRDDGFGHDLTPATIDRVIMSIREQAGLASAMTVEGGAAAEAAIRPETSLSIRPSQP